MGGSDAAAATAEADAGSVEKRQSSIGAPTAAAAGAAGVGRGGPAAAGAAGGGSARGSDELRVIACPGRAAESLAARVPGRNGLGAGTAWRYSESEK